MVTDGYSTFVNMFLALDASWDERNDDTLAGYLSEASPFTFAGRGSADPAVWSEFSSAFAARFPQGTAHLEDAHEFVRDYLADISDEYSRAYPGRVRLADAFEEIAPLGRWVEVFEPQGTEGRPQL